MQKSKRYISGKKRNKRQAFQNRFLTIMLLAVIIVLVFCGFKTSASTSEDHLDYSYHTITVEDGDSLWSIAREYADQTDDDVNSYIETLKKMNAIDNDEISAGQTLLVYYYEQ